MVLSCVVLFFYDWFSAKEARSIVTVLRNRFSSMESVCDVTLTTQNGSKVRGVNLLKGDRANFSTFPNKVAVSGDLSIKTISPRVDVLVWRTFAS